MTLLVQKEQPPSSVVYAHTTEQDFICPEEFLAKKILKCRTKAIPRKVDEHLGPPQNLSSVEGGFEITEAECKQKIFFLK